MEYLCVHGWVKVITIDPENRAERLFKWLWEDGHTALEHRFVSVDRFVNVMSDRTWNRFREEFRAQLLEAVAHNIEWIVFK